MCEIGEVLNICFCMWSQLLWKHQNNASSFSSLPLLSTCYVFLYQFKCLGLGLRFSLGLFVCLCWKYHSTGLFGLLGFCRLYSRECQGQSCWLQIAGVCHPTRPVHLPRHEQTQQNFWSCQSRSNHQCFRYAGKEGVTIVLPLQLLPCCGEQGVWSTREEEEQPQRVDSVQGAKFKYKYLIQVPTQAISSYILTLWRLAQLSFPECLMPSCTLCPRSTLGKFIHVEEVMATTQTWYHLTARWK